MNKRSILVFRFSAMGDVAMISPVIEQLCEQHPQVSIILVSRPFFKPFFDTNPQIRFHPIYPKEQHRGLRGLYRLFKELRNYKIDAIADLHDSLRSRILSTFFRLTTIPIKRIDKGRAEKRALTRIQNKHLIPLKSTFERYAEVFQSLGFSIRLTNKLVKKTRPLPAAFLRQFNSSSALRRIGIAPFAQHRYKVYPLDKMEEVIAVLSRNHELFIFGGGETEQEMATKWEKKYAHVTNVIGVVDLTHELDLIANLDLMLSMDSSGMHMASLVGTRVISVWGPTHPYAGFLGFGQKEDDCLQFHHPARPSSIYGNKPCLCDGIPCIERISPEQIVTKIEKTLSYG
ncbi:MULTISPECIES: glycosyltransferase family 9 protein [Olivibacter]|jgi:ADP-heptose:LPS heptosyltransferase|uniref:Glycosyl transferase family 9 n=2 Tax=Sphingobacteriaceae TaxID=84566 RepID=F4C7D8_SPHS2|nr:MULTISPECIES: glycosyltransferase family 9 protein [Olivibacter]MDM8175756.1 glycosyltransferase family 9 protein [Olivibacter sp. 47]QEL02489.1 glycosyltransferase family 9 protein [Olivibacter sp. LS-1]